MDVTTITTEDINQMTDEQRKEYAKELVRSAKENPGIKAAFYNPITKQTVTLVELIRQFGEEKTLEFLSEALGGAGTRKTTLTKEGYEKLLEKEANGTITEDEMHLLNMADMAFENSDQVQFQKSAASLLISLTKFAQNIPKYNPTIGDLCVCFNLITLSSLALVDKPENNYYGDIDTLADIGDQIGKDILDTWKESLTSEVSNDKIIAGLCQALIKTIRDSYDIKLPLSNVLFEYLELDENEFALSGNSCDCESEDCESECCCNCSSDDKEMKNMLKE